MDQHHIYYLNPSQNSSHQKVLDYIGRDQIILDVGCSTGYLGKLMKDKGNVVYGVELDGSAAAEAKTLLDEVIEADLDSVDFPWQNDFFDMVVCADVLEHLRDPIQVLQKLRKLLKRGGRLLVCLPNIAHCSIRIKLLKGEFDYEDTGILDRTHLKFFTVKTAKSMLEDAGFAVNEVDFTYKSPRWFRFVKKLSPMLHAGVMKRYPEFFGFQIILLASPSANPAAPDGYDK